MTDMSVATGEIAERINGDIPGAGVRVLGNPSPSGQDSILVDPACQVEVFRYLRDTPGLEFDFLSNLSAVDWPKPEVADKVAVENVEESGEGDVEEAAAAKGGFLEVVYHLYSQARRVGPLVLRARTVDRGENNAVASVSSVFRSAEFQEREAYDLFGIDFTGHPDLRRILMWDEFEDHPMRKDYVNPDDYEYEPTPHAGTLKRAEAHYPKVQEEAQEEGEQE